MKAFIKKLSLLFAVGAIAFGSGLHHEDTKVARAEATATLSFANKAQRTSFSTTKQVWEQNGITFTNDKASSTNAVADYAAPVRLYAGSSIEVKIDSGEITKIVFDANNGSYATELKNSIGSSATASSDKVTVTNINNTTFTVAKMTAQIRLDSIAVTYNESTGGGGTVDPEPEEPETPSEGGYTLVKKVSDLAVGKKVIIAAKDSAVAMSTEQKSNNRGQAPITKNGNIATLGDNVQEFTLESGKVSGTFAFNTGNGYIHAASSNSNNLRTETNLTDNSSWSIEITSTGVATIKAQGTYTRNILQYNQSSSLFSCYGSASQKAVCLYVLNEGNSGDSGETPSVESILLDKESASINVDEKITLKATVNPEGANSEVIWSSSSPNVATVENGVVTGISVGTTTIRVTSKENEKIYDECIVTVKINPYTYELITDVTDLFAGDKIVIAAKDSDVAMSTTQNGNNRGQATITKDGTTVKISSETQLITLEEGQATGTYAFYTGSGYLCAASSSENYLRTETTLSANSSWTISIASTGVATVKAQGNNTRNWLRYNNTSKIFSCYASGQQDVAIYKEIKLVSSIELVGVPNKVNYLNDESFDATGLSLNITYIDGTSETISATKAKWNNVYKGDTSVSGTYNGHTLTYNGITVEDRTIISISVTNKPNKVNYEEGELFDPSGLVITAAYNDNSTKTIEDASTKCEFTPSTSVALTKNDTKIIISYTEDETTVTTTLEITIVDGPVFQGDFGYNSEEGYKLSADNVDFYAFTSDIDKPETENVEKVLIEDSSKGVHIGTNNNPPQTVRFVGRFVSFAGEGLKIKINASTTSGGNGKLKVYLGNTQIGAEVALSPTETDYEFEADENTPESGYLTIEMNATEGALYLKSIKVYGEMSSNDDAFCKLVNDITTAETCRDYNKAASYRETYNSLSEEDKTIFSYLTCADQDYDWANGGKENPDLLNVTVSLMDKLTYMEYLAGLEKQSEGLSSNLLSNITSSNNILIILVVGLLGLTSILGYYFLNKKKYAR